jgi:hypothetical protein
VATNVLVQDPANTAKNTITIPTAGTSGLTIVGAAGQTVPLQSWKDSTGKVISSLAISGVQSWGDSAWGTAANTVGSTIQPGMAGFKNQGRGDVYLNSGTPPAGLYVKQLQATPTEPNYVMVRLQQAAGQTNNIMEVENAAGTGKLFILNKDGNTQWGTDNPFRNTVTTGGSNITGGGNAAFITPKRAHIFFNGGLPSAGINIQILAASFTPLSVENASGTVIAGITNTGNVKGTGAYTTISDIKTKSSVEDIPTDIADVVARIQPRRFKRLVPKQLDSLAQPGDVGGDTVEPETVMVPSDKWEYGFVAQELEQVVPEAVVDFDEDGTKGVQETQLIPIMFAALKAIDTRLKALEAK